LAFAILFQSISANKRVAGKGGGLPVMRSVHSFDLIAECLLGCIPLADMLVVLLEPLLKFSVKLCGFSRPQLTLQSCPVAPAFVALFPAQSQTTISY
jgi:hypothetical protein